MSLKEQGRKWNITIQQSEVSPVTTEMIREKIESLTSVSYACFAEEVATTGKHHFHLYLVASAPIRFSTIQNVFEGAHIEKAYGSSVDNRNYIAKEGRWAQTEKVETKMDGSFEEVGVLPVERAPRSEKNSLVMQRIKDGASKMDILREFPEYAFRVKDLDILMSAVRTEIYETKIREIKVVYIYGDNRKDIKDLIYSRHSIADVFKVMIRKNNDILFDGYSSQSVLVIQDFVSQISIQMMLSLLDPYPTQLPARYMNKIACYTTVYVTSDLPPKAQYYDVQTANKQLFESWMDNLDCILKINSSKEFVFERGGL